jgi:hypothetical protein
LRGHLSEEIKVKLHRKEFDLVVVVCGKTSQNHALSVSVYEPFNDYLRKECKAW